MKAVRWKRTDRWTSWHLVRPGDDQKTVCGQPLTDDVKDRHFRDGGLPEGKTCEHCATQALNSLTFIEYDNDAVEG